MLATRQVAILAGLGLLFWIAATAWIRCFPQWFEDPLECAVVFLVSAPACWRCIVAAQRVARLSREQLVAGTAVVVAVATLIDAVALRWTPDVYAGSDLVRRLGAAWLLWGYGVSLGIALLMQRRALIAA